MLNNKVIQSKLLAIEVRQNALALQIKKCRNEITSLRSKVKKLQRENDNEIC